MNNPYVVKCFICGKFIDKRLAIKDARHHYAYFKNANVYLHLNKCLKAYHDRISKKEM